MQVKKKVYVLLVFTLIVSAEAYCDKSPFSNKTTIQGIFGFPIGEYGMEAGTGGGDYEVDAVIGGQVGSKFYLWNSESLGAGLYINWLDIIYAQTPLSFEEEMTITDTGLFETGVIGSFHFNDSYMLDLYYQVRPTFMLNSLSTNYFKYPALDDMGLYDRVRRWGLGISHVVGLGFNFDIFSFGAEFGFGAVSHFYPEFLLGEPDNQPAHPVMSPEADLQSECVRIFLGVQL